MEKTIQWGSCLHGRLRAENVFILSAGWGLLSADFLTPNYDISFSTTAKPERYKRRRVWDGYRDFCMLTGDRIEPVVFLGGKGYVPLFQSVTESIRGTRIIFYNSAVAPDAPDCVCRRFETKNQDELALRVRQGVDTGSARYSGLTGSTGETTCRSRVFSLPNPPVPTPVIEYQPRCPIRLLLRTSERQRVEMPYSYPTILPQRLVAVPTDYRPIEQLLPTQHPSRAAAIEASWTCTAFDCKFTHSEEVGCH